MMRVFFDSEFTGLQQNTTLISIGLISETNKMFYAEFDDYDKTQVDNWIQENVIANLISSTVDPPIFDVLAEDEIWKQSSLMMLLNCYRNDIDDYLKRWFVSLLEENNEEQIEIWSDTLAYDWVLFCELFGGALKLPNYIYYIPFDLATLFDISGVDPDENREQFAFGEGSSIETPTSIPKVFSNQHNALWDAVVIKGCYDRLDRENRWHR